MYYLPIVQYSLSFSKKNSRDTESVDIRDCMSGATALSLQGHTTPPLKVWDTQNFFFLDWLSKNLFYYLFMPKCLLLILLWLIFLKRLNSLYYQTIKDLALKNHICTLKSFFRLKLSDVILSLNLFKKCSSIRFEKNEIKNQCFFFCF